MANMTELTRQVLAALETAANLLEQKHEDQAQACLDGLDRDAIKTLAGTSREAQARNQEAEDTSQKLSDGLLTTLGKLVAQEQTVRKSISDAVARLQADQTREVQDKQNAELALARIAQLNDEIRDIQSKIDDATHVSGKDFIPVYGPARRIAISVDALKAAIDGKFAALNGMHDELNAFEGQVKSSQADEAAAATELSSITATLTDLKAQESSLGWMQPRVEAYNKILQQQVANSAAVVVYYTELQNLLNSVARNLDDVRIVSNKLKQPLRIYCADGRQVDGTLRDAVLEQALEIDLPAADLPGAVPAVRGLYPTGCGDDGKVLAAGSQDPHYRIIEVQNQPAVVVANVASYVPNDASSAWVWQQADGQPTNVTRTFRLTFELGVVPKSCMISGLWATDNEGLDILVNGSSTGQSIRDDGGKAFQSLTPFRADAGFIKGKNTLDFVVKDVGGIAAFRVASIFGVLDADLSTIPRLVFETTGDFTEMWSDKESGAHTSGAFYRTNPPPGFFSIGDYGQGDYATPGGRVVVVQAVNDDAGAPLLAAPTGATQIVNDKGSGASQDGSFWLPQAPPGYVAVGCVVQSGYGVPDVSRYRCLRADLVEPGSIGGLIYADHGSGADADMAIYRLTDTNVIWANLGYAPPAATLSLPRGMTLRAKT